MLRKIIVVLLLVINIAARSYPKMHQCDFRWAGDHVGLSNKTICEAGGHVTCVAMALSAVDQQFNPGTLNKWLQERNGFKKDMIVWEAVNPLGLQYAGTIPNSYIGAALRAGSVVIVNTHRGSDWALATSLVGTTLYVNEPHYYNDSYNISDIVVNESILYAVPGNWLGIMID